MSDDRDRQQCDDLEQHIARCLDEHVFDVDGDGIGRWRLPEGPVILVRRSDGTRFLVEIDVTVTVSA